MNVIKFPAPDDGVSVSYKTIKEYEGTSDCQRIVLCHGQSRTPDREDTYAVIFMAPPGSVDGFAIIAEFKHTEIGLQMAQMVADAADKTLANVHMLQPDNEEDWTAQEIDDLCAEALSTFGPFAAQKLRTKLTSEGGAS